MKSTKRCRPQNSLAHPALEPGIEIREISAEETYPVRRPVLRPGRPAEECVFGGDELSSTLHLGVFLGEKLVAVASFMQQQNALFEAHLQYQLRGMAVLEDLQKMGLGEELLLAGEKLLKERFKKLLLWFNARETAIGFYEKYGYQTRGDLFMIPNVCPHIVMYKQLTA